MTLAAGDLRHRISIERQKTSQNPVTGERSTSWANVASNVPAQIAPISAREFIAGQAVQSQIVARIVIRYRDGLDASMRIKHGAKIYNIAGVLPDPDSGREYLTLPCTAGVNDG